MSTALGTCRCLFKLHHFSSLFHRGTHASDTNKASLGHIMLELYQHHGLIFPALRRIIEEHTKNFSHEQCYTHTHIQTHLHPTVENSCFMYKYLHCIPLHLGLISQDWPKPVYFILEDDLNILLSCLYFHSANITDLSHLPGLGSAGTQTQHLMNAKQAVCQLSYISISFNFFFHTEPSFILSAFPSNTKATSETQM